MSYPYFTGPGYPGALSPEPSAPARPSNRSRIWLGLRYAVGFLVVIWSVFIFGLVVGGQPLGLGVQPLDPSSLWHIFTSPLIHLNLAHIMSNSVPGAIFVFLVALSGRRAFWEVTLYAAVIGGLGTWFFGGIGTSHVGASGVIYGWLAYLIMRGFFNRSLSQVLLGLVLTFFYGGLIYGVLPTDSGVSWQGHLFGGFGGLVASATITSDDPPALVAKRNQRRLERQQRR